MGNTGCNLKWSDRGDLPQKMTFVHRPERREEGSHVVTDRRAFQAKKSKSMVLREEQAWIECDLGVEVSVTGTE
jgi:hypothetical protein